MVMCRFEFWSADATDNWSEMSEFVLIDQLLLRGVRYGFLFEIDRTLIWWVTL